MESGALPSHVRIAVVGAGFSGLCMAIRLRQEGIEDFVVLERASDVGGTWRDNDYPGIQCDIPSALYSLSFAPNPDWTRFYSEGAEIQAYLKRVARDFDVTPRVRFGCELLGADWDEDARHWRLETSRGSLTADLAVAAMGGLSQPAIPDIPGRDLFEGTMFHSSSWDHEHGLGGERVAAIGTGASAIQFVPRIQPQVGRLHLFQRTPVWVMPDGDRPWSPRARRLFRRVPATQRLVRSGIYVAHEATVLGTIFNKRLLKLMQRVAYRHLCAQVADPELRAKLTPSYTIGCKRITMSDTYFPALAQPNVEVVTEPIREVRARSIVTADGVERELDTIIWGTGFRVSDNPMFARIRGRQGRSMEDAWNGSPRAYLGTTVAGFPNLFLIVGPNSAGGFNSIVFTTEAHVNYALGALRAMEARGAEAVEVRLEVYEAFNREAERRLGHSVWNEGGCASWYLDRNGRNGVWWPGFMTGLWRRTRRFDPGDYRLLTV